MTWPAFASAWWSANNIINGRGIRPGDLVLGLASTGLHSNGYSLVRKIVLEKAGLRINDFVPELGRTVGEELLEPTRIYVRRDQAIAGALSGEAARFRGLAHITGEGLEGNIPRILPPGGACFWTRANGRFRRCFPGCKSSAQWTNRRCLRYLIWV